MDPPRSTVNVALTQAANGTFTVAIGADTYAGSYSTAGILVSLAPDAASQSALLELITDESSTICEKLTVDLLNGTHWNLKPDQGEADVHRERRIGRLERAVCRDTKYTNSGKGSWSSAP